MAELHARWSDIDNQLKAIAKGWRGRRSQEHVEDVYCELRFQALLKVEKLGQESSPRLIVKAAQNATIDVLRKAGVRNHDLSEGAERVEVADLDGIAQDDHEARIIAHLESTAEARRVAAEIGGLFSKPVPLVKGERIPRGWIRRLGPPRGSSGGGRGSGGSKGRQE